jgi:hypothetical protein
MNVTNKICIKAHTSELKQILTNISANGTFTSNSVGVDGRRLGLMVRKDVIVLAGFDRKKQRNVYKISIHQQSRISKILNELGE